MEKQILLDQLDDKVKKAFAILLSLYPRLLDGDLETEEVYGILEVTEGLRCCFSTIADIQYNNNIESYKDLIYKIGPKGYEHE